MGDTKTKQVSEILPKVSFVVPRVHTPSDSYTTRLHLIASLRLDRGPNRLACGLVCTCKPRGVWCFQAGLVYSEKSGMSEIMCKVV